MAYVCLSDFVYDCAQCHTRCDGISKGVYTFENDVAFSEVFENEIINRFNRAGYIAAKCEKPGYPDIEIRNRQGELIKYMEVKVQQRTFMSVEKILPESNLKPSETVALNLSDLLRYFEIEQKDGIPVSISWVLLNRLCLVPMNSHLFFYQKLGMLKKAYKAAGDKRRFRRKSGEGDIVDGIHKGVTVNYHFSLKELLPLII